MKRKILTGLTFLTIFYSTAQEKSDTTVKLDLLKTPSSPGFILLNKQPSDIERPTTPTDFAFSIRNASDNFSAIPKNYALEIAPAWLFSGNKINYKDAYGATSHKNVGKNILQTLGLSCAVNTEDSAFGGKNTQLAVGLKFSIVRGKISDEFAKSVDDLKAVLAEIGQGYVKKKDEALLKDSVYQSLVKLMAANPSLASSIAITLEKIENLKGEEIKNELNKTYESKLKKLTDIKVERYGWFLDAAGGIVTDFPQQIFENAQTNKAGGWLTGGYESKKHISFLGVARYLNGGEIKYTAADSSQKSYTDNTLDLGARLVYDINKFSVSLEGLYRNNFSTYKPYEGWKATFFMGYDMGNNKLLTLNITRDFNGAISRKGTLITALNLIIGFGSKRKVTN